jgi:hypothetical protein
MDLTDQARSFFLWNKGGEGRAGRISPGGGGGIPGGVERPRILRAGPAGTTEGGDHLPRRCRTRGEANRKKIPFLKSRISKNVGNSAVSRENPYLPRNKAISIPEPFRLHPSPGISPRFPENGNGKRESTGLQSCNRGHEGDRCMCLFLLLFTKLPHGPFLAALNGMGKRSEPGKKGEGK